MTGYDPWDFCGKEELVLHGKSQVKFPKTWNIIYHKNNNLVIYSFYPTIKIVWSTNWRTDNDFQTVTCAKLERYDHWLVIYHLYYMSSHITSWNEHCFILKSSCRNSVSNIFILFFYSLWLSNSKNLACPKQTSYNFYTSYCFVFCFFGFPV